MSATWWLILASVLLVAIVGFAYFGLRLRSGALHGRIAYQVREREKLIDDVAAFDEAYPGESIPPVLKSKTKTKGNQ